MAVSLALAALSPVRAPLGAIPITTPRPTATPSATPPPLTNELPIASTIELVLDGEISSASSKKDEIIKAHLRNPIVLDGTTIAAAGAPTRIRILDAKPADNPDIYGYVDIYLYPLLLANGTEIPLRPPTTHLNVNITAGHASTASVENTIGDVYAPTLLLHMLRKGRNFVLLPGSVFRAQTEATVRVTRSGVVSVTTPAPLLLDAQTPHSSFNAMPLSTPASKKDQPLMVPSDSPIPTLPTRPPDNPNGTPPTPPA